MLELLNFNLKENSPVAVPNLKAMNLTGLIGLNGSGKTTLLRTIAGIHKNFTGEILFNGTPLAKPLHLKAKTVAWCPDQMDIPSSFRVIDILLLGRYPIHQGYPSQKDLFASRELLSNLDALHLENKSITEISAGERQKVMVARALNQETPYLLLDEPTAHLDLKATRTIMNVLKKASATKTILIAMHDLGLAWQYSDHLWLMSECHVIAQGPTQTIMTEERLSLLYETQLEIHSRFGPQPFSK